MRPLQLVTPFQDQRRLELRGKIDRLATALERGEIAMSPTEFEALAQICIDYFLPVEAARVRRWIVTFTNHEAVR